MCVRILYKDQEKDFDKTVPLELQLQGSQQIVVNYVPKDSSVEAFLDEIERIYDLGVSCNLNIKFVHGDNIAGALAKKKILKLKKEFQLNDIIKMLASSHHEVDKKLEKLQNSCSGRKNDE